MKTFCNWCNHEAIERCDLCKSLYCGSHRGYDVYHLSLPRLEEAENTYLKLRNFMHTLLTICPDLGKGKGTYDEINYTLTYKNFYEKVYLKIDFKEFPKQICKYCEDKVSRLVKEKLLPVLQSAKDSRLICAYGVCLFDSEWKCINCGKSFCHKHLVQCKMCSKVFCCSGIAYYVVNDGVLYNNDGCQKVHKHLFGKQYWTSISIPPE